MQNKADLIKKSSHDIPISSGLPKVANYLTAGNHVNLFPKNLGYFIYFLQNMVEMLYRQSGTRNDSEQQEKTRPAI